MKKRKVQSVIFYCAKNNKKHFLLLQMNKKRNLLWQNVTGGVDDHESFEDAALREAIEETDLSPINVKKLIPSDLEFKFTDQWEKFVTEKVFFIQCNTQWPIKIDPTEHCGYKWVSESEVTINSVHYESNYQALKKAIGLKC